MSRQFVVSVAGQAQRSLGMVKARETAWFGTQDCQSSRIVLVSVYTAPFNPQIDSTQRPPMYSFSRFMELMLPANH